MNTPLLRLAREVHSIYPDWPLVDVVNKAARFSRMTPAERQSALFYARLDEEDRVAEQSRSHGFGDPRQFRWMRVTP